MVEVIEALLIILYVAVLIAIVRYAWTEHKCCVERKANQQYLKRKKEYEQEIQRAGRALVRQDALAALEQHRQAKPKPIRKICGVFSELQSALEEGANNMDRYKQKGFSSRDEYLDSLADEFGTTKEAVYALADMFGPSEDFDGLVDALEDERI